MQPKLKFSTIGEYVLADKPHGIATHAVHPSCFGLAEMLSEAANQQLKVIHRLDSTTTGVLLLGSSASATAIACKAFEERRVEKSYLFISDRTLPIGQSFTHESVIEKRQSRWTSSQTGQTGSTSPNAITEFACLTEANGLTLWQAKPLTGKTHQIRLHASDCGIPILGDDLYGGSDFPQVMLHAAELNIPSLGIPPLKSTPSILMENLALCSNPNIAQWLLGIERRNRLFDYGSQDCLRMIHTEGGDLRADKMGEVLCLYWYGDAPPTSQDLEIFPQLAEMAQCQRYVIYQREKEVRGPSVEKSVWIARENDINYELREGHGISPGLFLDQRQQRFRVLSTAAGKTMLNLFCYSCGFSVAAAKAGARAVTSVDLSKSALEWGKRNFEVNNLGLSDHQFFAQDSREFLQRCKRQGRNYDIVVCDPPSFSYGKKKAFSLEREIKQLISDCLDVLAPNGELYFSCNYERITTQELQQLLSELTPAHGWKIENIPSGLDYELPGQEPLLKSFVVSLRPTPNRKNS
jgi:23S rRNA (cytosine1962-C5)-methyltransferase